MFPNFLFLSKMVACSLYTAKDSMHCGYCVASTVHCIVLMQYSVEFHEHTASLVHFWKKYNESNSSAIYGENGTIWDIQTDLLP